MQGLQGCGTPGQSFLTETLSRGMHGEPGTHPETCSQSSRIFSHVNVDSSCGSENSTPPCSPESFASGQCRQHSRANMMHLHTVKVDTDTGVTTPLSVLGLCLCSSAVIHD